MPFERRTYPAAELMARHPPVITHANKRVLYDISCPPDAVHGGSLEYSRWFAMPLPPTCSPGAAPELALVREDWFDYEPLGADPAAPAPAAPAPAPSPAAPVPVEWHVNFADPRLFGYYGDAFFAQDEMQVAEHPALASLREALKAAGLPPLTIEQGVPTPVLVTGVERRISMAIDPNPGEGRLIGLYGRAFPNASEDALRRACTRLDPPTLSNILVICAPRANYGAYTAGQIEFTLQTAYTGFRAAAIESARLVGGASGGADRPRVAVHSGFWGCGAFGGNRVMMILLQLIAAQMAAIDTLVLHVGNPSGRSSVDRAFELARGLAAVTETPTLVARLAALGLPWGRDDGS